MKRLIINADDFGLAPGVNRAIVELQQAGALSSTTLMATGPYFSPAVYMAFAQPELAVGCHVVLVDGSPCLRPDEVPSLLDPLDSSCFRITVGMAKETLLPMVYAFTKLDLRPSRIRHLYDRQVLNIAGADFACTYGHRCFQLAMQSRQELTPSS